MAGSRPRELRRSTRGRSVLRDAPRRGACYRVAHQGPGTVGLLVVSSNRHNRHREITALPVTAEPLEPPTIEIEGGVVALGNLVRRPVIEVEDEVLVPPREDLERVYRELADLLLLPELCQKPPQRPGRPPTGDYPRLGRTYFAEPALGGEVKRWLVVSHDGFNAGTDRAICLRTTSNISLHAPEMPYIQRGFALAVIPDVMTKRHARFDLGSAAQLEQVVFDELRPIAIALANLFALHRQAGLM